MKQRLKRLLVHLLSLLPGKPVIICSPSETSYV